MATSKRTKITVQGIEIGIETIEGQDFLSLTDIVRTQESDFVLYSWLKNHDAIDFLAIWESQHNPLFQRSGYDAIKARLHEKRFTLSPSKWVEATVARGIFSKKGKHGGGTFAHEDIALEFCSWLSPVFKFYVFTEFKRLKTEEAARLGSPEWSLRRELSKANYAVHADSIRQHLVPLLEQGTRRETPYFSSEADLLNVAVFGQTAREWRETNPDKKGNARDWADTTELQVLANMESLNAGLIEMGFSQDERLAVLLQRAARERQVLGEMRASEKIKRLE